MRILPNVALAALLLGSTGATSAFAAGDTGCPPGMHRADPRAVVRFAEPRYSQGRIEFGGVGSRNLDTRKAEAEGGGSVPEPGYS